MGTRTPDLLIANETLYQLSYTPNVLIVSQLHTTSDQDFRLDYTVRLYSNRKCEESMALVTLPNAAPASFSEVFRMSLV